MAGDYAVGYLISPSPGVPVCGYLAFALDLPGCMADGQTPEEAVKELGMAVTEWLDEASRLGREIPAPGIAVQRAKETRDQLLDTLAKQTDLVRRQDTILKQQDNLLNSAIGQIVSELEELKDRLLNSDSVGVTWALAVKREGRSQRVISGASIN